MRNHLTKQQVVEAVERISLSAEVPLLMCKWWGDGTPEKYGAALNEIADRYPDDIFVSWYTTPGEDTSPLKNPQYRFGYKEKYDDAARHSIGNVAELLSDWDDLELFLDNFPNPYEEGNFDVVMRELPAAGERYKIGAFWRLFHEKLWEIRGMENLFIDYYENMDGLKTIADKLLDFYKVIVDRYAELGFDAIFTSDDLGHQTGPMMSPDIFKEFYLPLYKDFIGYVHSKGMRVFLHSCGDNTKLMDYLLEAGLDVFHPVQRGCMDEKETATNFGGRITFLVGIDVQHLLPEASPTEIKESIINTARTFYRNEGGLLLAAGNGIMPDVPLENIEAMLDTVTNIKKYL